MSNTASSQPTAHPAVQIDWGRGMQFDAGRPGGPQARIDGDAKSGRWPLDMLLCAIAACVSTDVVLMLETQDMKLTELNVRAEARRACSPRCLATAALHFRMRGAKLSQVLAEAALTESITKYCGVRASLIQGALVTWTVYVLT